MRGPLLLGKLTVRGRLNAVVPGELVHVTDQITSRRFLVDTGAAFSIFPHQSSAPPSGPSLSGPCGKNIPCWGERRLDLCFSGRRFQWTFLLAAVQFPILGVDFLRHHRLLVDPAAGSLVFGKPHSAAAVQLSGPHTAASPPPSVPVRDFAATAAVNAPKGSAAVSSRVATCGPPSAFKQLIEQFPGVVNPSKVLPASTHGVQHHIVTKGPPVSSKFRRLDGEKLAAAKAEFAALERDGIVRRSSSPWASPLHMVRKADGSWRPCGDYRRLNVATVPDSYPLPNMLDFAARVAGCTIFSKIDLRKGYYQILMHPAKIEKTAVTTPFGLFEFNRLPFGLRNAGNTFQRMMDRVLAGLDFAFAYLDDIIVASRSEAEHLVHLRLLFERLQQFGLVINGEKCVFGQSSVDFLGHRVSSRGALPLSTHVSAILEFPRPQTVKQLQGFLGTVNFYRRFLPGAAKFLKPLTDSLRGSPRPQDRLEWSEQMQSAMQAAKQAISQATHLVHPSPAAEISLMVDASAEHVGAVLQQLPRGGRWVFSQKSLSQPR